MRITKEGRAQVNDPEFALIVDLMLAFADWRTFPQAMSGTRSFVATVLCSRERHRSFAEHEVNQFVSANRTFLDRTIKNCLRIAPKPAGSAAA